MGPRELEKLLKVCRKYGVKAIKMDTSSLELQLDTDAPQAPSLPQTSTEASSQPEAALTDDEVLLWSSSQQ